MLVPVSTLRNSCDALPVPRSGCCGVGAKGNILSANLGICNSFTTAAALGHVSGVILVMLKGDNGSLGHPLARALSLEEATSSQTPDEKLVYRELEHSYQPRPVF